MRPVHASFPVGWGLPHRLLRTPAQRPEWWGKPHPYRGLNLAAIEPFLLSSPSPLPKPNAWAQAADEEAEAETQRRKPPPPTAAAPPTSRSSWRPSVSVTVGDRVNGRGLDPGCGWAPEPKDDAALPGVAGEAGASAEVLGTSATSRPSSTRAAAVSIVRTSP